MLKHPAFLLLLLLVAACGLPHQVNSTRLPEGKTAAVMAVFGNTFSFNERMLFGTKTETVPADWNLSGYVEDQAIAVLRQRYEIKRLPYDPAIFSGLPTSADLSSGKAKEPASRLKSFATPGQVDLIVLLVNQTSGGYSRGGRGGSIGTFYQVIVFDGKTLEPIAAEQGGVPCNRPERLVCLPGYDYVTITTPYEWDGAPADRIPLQVREYMRATMMSLMTESIPHTFGRMGLAPKQ